jgi:hypothetical protein
VGKPAIFDGRIADADGGDDPPSTPIEAVMIIALRKPSESERAHGALGVPPRTKDA